MQRRHARVFLCRSVCTYTIHVSFSTTTGPDAISVIFHPWLSKSCVIQHYANCGPVIMRTTSTVQYETRKKSHSRKKCIDYFHSPYAINQLSHRFCPDLHNKLFRSLQYFTKYCADRYQRRLNTHYPEKIPTFFSDTY